MKIVLVHDSFTQMGGAERVVNDLHELFPEAPIFTLVLNNNIKKNYQGWDIRTSWLQVIYNFIPKLQYLLPLIPLAVRSLNFENYDIVLSSSSGFVKNIKVPKTTIHINYCHTPTRFLWTDTDYIEQESPFFLKPALKIFLSWMKKWDYNGAKRVHYFIANSKEVQKRIKHYYNKESVLIYPGINLSFWEPTRSKSSYFLVAGRLHAHKHNELIVEIFNEIGLPLHVVGTGRQENYLRSIAKPNITFFGRVSDEELRNEYSGALGFLYPQIEDAGLMPLEAAACGTPTLAYGKGGALETVVAEKTGEFFYDYNKEKIKQSILSMTTKKYLSNDLRAQAEKFSKKKFKENILAFIKSLK